MLPQSPPKLELANLPTEFRPLDRISESIGGPRIWLKSDDLTGALVSGNKVRKLEYLFAEAETLGCDTVMTCGGVQSNHCRATAAIAARRGLQSELILRGPRSLEERAEPYLVEEVYSEGLEANLLLDHLCGAKVLIYSPLYYAKNLSAIFEERQQHYFDQGQKAYPIPTGGSNALGLWGYIEAARELQNDFSQHGISPELVVCASGSGGTQGGLSLGFHLLGGHVNVLGMAVCDSVAYFDEKIRDDVDQWQQRFLPEEKGLSESLSVDTIDSYIGPGYAIGYPEVFEHIQWLAKTEGIVLDPVYTGKAFYALVSEIRSGRFDGMSDIVFVHTGGIYGVFPYKAQFT